MAIGRVRSDPQDKCSTCKSPPVASRKCKEDEMTKNDAEKLTTFKHYCTCGGYAHSMNGRNPRRPHKHWCPQRKEYSEWYDALHDEGDIDE